VAIHILHEVDSRKLRELLLLHPMLDAEVLYLLDNRFAQTVIERDFILTVTVSFAAIHRPRAVALHLPSRSLPDSWLMGGGG
jgi:hypothetical protein